MWPLLAHMWLGQVSRRQKHGLPKSNGPSHWQLGCCCCCCLLCVRLYVPPQLSERQNTAAQGTWGAQGIKVLLEPALKASLLAGWPSPLLQQLTG